MAPRTLLSLALAALCVTPTLALAHLGPRATDTSADAPDATGITPRPTAAPELKHKKRSQEAITNTCGWYNGDPSQPFSCNPGNACAFNTEASYFGCCSTDASGNYDSSDCGYITATPAAGCYDYTQASMCTGQCYYSDIICASTAPYCVSAVLFLEDSQALTHYACLTESAYRLLVVSATTTGSSAAASSTLSPINSAAASKSTSGHNNIVSPTTSGSGGSGSDTNSSPTPSPLPHHSSHIGAIVGGVVGGLVLIAVAAVGAIFVLRNKKKNQRKSIMPEVSQM